LLLARIEPALAPYLALVACLPALFWAVLAERRLLAAGRRRALIGVNLVLGALALGLAWQVETLAQAGALYAACFAVYAACVLALAGHGKARYPVIALALATLPAVALQTASPGGALVWQVMLLCVAVAGFGVRPRDLRHLGERL
jgi:hypothetical protein